MFVVKNAWQSVTRNKGRNILIIVIVTIIAGAATIGLSIRQAATTARNSGLENTTITAQISLDRNKLISESKSDSSSSDGKPDFDAMRSALADKQLSLSEYQQPDLGRLSEIRQGLIFREIHVLYRNRGACRNR